MQQQYACVDVACFCWTAICYPHFKIHIRTSRCLCIVCIEPVYPYMIGGEVKIIEGYGSRVNFHSNLWPECLFWTFRGLNNNSSFIDPEKAAQSVKMWAMQNLLFPCQAWRSVSFWYFFSFVLLVCAIRWKLYLKNKTKNKTNTFLCCFSKT